MLLQCIRSHFNTPSFASDDSPNASCPVQDSRRISHLSVCKKQAAEEGLSRAGVAAPSLELGLGTA